MPTKTVLLLILALVLGARGEPGPGPGGVAFAAPPVRATPLVGAWSGQWTAPTAVGAHGTVELVLAGQPGRDTLLGHFTFMAGGKSRTFRYEGRLENGVLRFPLVGEGRILLEPLEAARPGTAEVLQGGWIDAGGALPARSGTMQLTRAPVR